MDASDPFIRQRSVPDWNVDVIHDQAALLLGIGAIGCTAALALCRLGLKRLYLVDMDVVDVSNLNRQVLYAREDVGRRKVDAAIDGLARHNLHTELVPVHLDAARHWGKVVEMARQSTVIFNAIDYGEYFDYAVTSLCVSLGCHYVSASSYGHTSISENYTAVRNPGSGPCWACNNEPPDRSLLVKLTPEIIQGCSQIDFLPKDTVMPNTQSVGSSILPVSLAAYQAVTAWINSLFGLSMPNWSTFNLRSFEHFAFPVEQSSNCLLCKWKPVDRITRPLIIPKNLDADILELYFGLPNVNLSVVNGATYRYTKGCIEESREESGKADALCRLQPLSHLGKEYNHIYLPCVPARDLNSRELMESTDVAFLDDQLQLPMVKTASGSMKAIQSGGRSAILPGVDHVYRLKGCGNFVDQDGFRYEFPGFPVQAIEGTENGQEVRGCAFKHTAERELFMSEKIGQLLAGYDLQAGNVPIGMYQYRIEGELLPMVSKMCGIFQTIGEKRLASHLLSGLEILLPHFFPNLKLEEITNLFPPERLQKTDSGAMGVLPTWSACCTSSHPMQPVDLRKHVLPECVPSAAAVSVVSDRWRELWQTNCKQLNTILPLSKLNASEFGSLFAALYWRLGFEVGFFKRLLEDNNINWGYFIDHNQFEPHCNSHPNNFVVVPEVYGGNSQLLAAVDFDLTFTKETFFSPYTGDADDDLFVSWTSSEHYEMERALGGEEVNSGVKLSPKLSSKMTVGLNPPYDALRWSFRDTLLAGYRSAYYRLANDVPSCSPEVFHGMRSLVNLSLSVVTN